MSASRAATRPQKPKLSRYALLHIPLWLVATFFILFIYYDWKAAFAPQLATTALGTGMAALPTYYAMNRLVPRLLYRRRIGAFVLSGIGIAAANTLFTYFVAACLYYVLVGRAVFPSPFIVVYVCLVVFSCNIAAITLGCAFRIIGNRFSMETRLYEAEQEGIRTELAFLRAQVNPHFLFNVLNTIYFQIHKENGEARGSVEKLSELLRYQLYECTTDRIPIEKEIAYIRNYVGVQSLRMEPGTDVALRVAEEGMSNFRIAPLLLLPLVENAFKHISHHKRPADNRLHVSLHRADADFFVAEVANTFDAAHTAVHLLASGGLGLQNVRRRLELLYPGAHELTVASDGAVFKTILKIRFND